MAIYNTIPAPTNEENALLETTSSKPKSLKRIVTGGVGPERGRKQSLRAVRQRVHDVPGE